MHDGPLAARREPGLRPSTDTARPLVSILLVATAIFLIVLVLARTPLKGYVISQQVQAASDRAATAMPLATRQVAAWLKADAVLAGTVQQVCPHDSLATQNNIIEDLRHRLEIQEQEHHTVRPGWLLHLPHHDRQLAGRLLGKLSESLTGQLKHLDQAETQLLVGHYQKVVSQAREEEEAARLALERARHEQLARAMENQEREEPPPALGKPVNSADPARLELQQKVAQAEARLEQLLAARTPEHPQVIEAQSRLSQLQEQLNQLPREQHNEHNETAPRSDRTPALQGPRLQQAASAARGVTVRLVSSAGESGPGETLALAKQLQALTLQWTTATSRRTAAERSYHEAQQQWVRSLNAAGWEASPIWTEAQQGGRQTPFQLLLASSLALIGAIGAWRLTLLASRAGLLTSAPQIAEMLPLPVLGEVPLSTAAPRRLPEALGKQLVRLSQLSLAVVIAVLLVCTWASSVDPNLSGLWGNDPLSAIGQAFDLLHHRVVR